VLEIGVSIATKPKKVYIMLVWAWLGIVRYSYTRWPRTSAAALRTETALILTSGEAGSQAESSARPPTLVENPAERPPVGFFLGWVQRIAWGG